MRQPEGFIIEGQEHLVCKLNKGTYGLKQSGRVWHQTLKNGIESIGFTAGNANTTVFSRFGKRSIELSGWYVDDGLLAEDSTRSMDQMIKDLRGSFDIQDLGEPERLLGIKIKRDRDEGTIHISHPAFINMIAKHFDPTLGKSFKSPMDCYDKQPMSQFFYIISGTDKTTKLLVKHVHWCTCVCTVVSRASKTWSQNTILSIDRIRYRYGRLTAVHGIDLAT
jgi:hypothetical protein